MQTHLHENASTFSPELGEFVSDSHMQLARVLKDYKPTLELVYIPKNNRGVSDTKPWAIIDHHPRLGDHIIRFMSDAEMLEPAKILAWVFEGDLDKHDPRAIIKKIELEENAKQLLSMQREMDAKADAMERVEFLASGGRNRLNYIRYNGRKITRS